MPDAIPSKVQQEIWARTERDDEPLYATWQTGVEWRYCLLDCDRLTDRNDRVCDAHDYDPGGPLWGIACPSETRASRRAREPFVQAWLKENAG